MTFRFPESPSKTSINHRRDGNQALGVYVDKENPTDVSKQFEYMLSYARVLPKYLPDLHRYLLAYPNAKSANIDDIFYWAKVKFGLKPTLRVVQLVTLRGRGASEPAFAIAEKQLYSSHYFETALDLTFCVRDPDNPKQSGFYLIRAMGSEQAGLTGLKGSMCAGWQWAGQLPPWRSRSPPLKTFWRRSNNSAFAKLGALSFGLLIDRNVIDSFVNRNEPS